MKKKEKYKKPPGLLSLPLAQSFTDVFQLHSKSITETFAEIMIKTLASCHFDLIRDILASFFFVISYQSSTQLNDLPLFKQLTSLAAKEPTVTSHEKKHLTSQKHLHLCCSSLYQSHLLLMRHPVQLFLSAFGHDAFQCFCTRFPRVKVETS